MECGSCGPESGKKCDMEGCDGEGTVCKGDKCYCAECSAKMEEESVDTE